MEEEQQYLNLLKTILSEGVERPDRTGIGTLSIFGATMRFSLRGNIIPLLTTKKVYWRGIVLELLWMISGSTNGHVLHDQGVHIWDANGTREYLDSIGLQHHEEMDLGPIYGFQWRHFGAKYTTMHEDYSGMGIDQLAEVIRKIKDNPSDRRIVLSAWNPSDFHEMALPPCHTLAQFYVANGELSCQMYQRSGDMALGVPFNIVSYSILVRIIAQVCGLLPGEFIHVLGDAHIYLSHIEAIRNQVDRIPGEFPTLTINPDKSTIDGFEWNDFELHDYTPQEEIKMKQAV